MEVFDVHDRTCGTVYPARSDESVLEAMRRSHQGCITFGCGGGGCGVCKIQVLSGEVEVFKRMSRAHVSDADRENNVLLACCIRPLSDIALKRAQCNDQ